MTNKERQEVLVDMCLSDTKYLLSLYSLCFDLGRTEIFDIIKERLREEFEKNVYCVYGDIEDANT